MSNAAQTMGNASPKATVASSVSAADRVAVTKRLQSELMGLMSSADPGVSAFPAGDSLFSWVGTIAGSAGTAYEGLSYKLSLDFPADYPYQSPTVRFVTSIFHPNVDTQGNICLDILKEKWSAAYSVRTILLSIQSLLGEPNNESPLNVHAAQLWSNQKAYRSMVTAHTPVPNTRAEK